jgi:hypothetical protein
MESYLVDGEVALTYTRKFRAYGIDVQERFGGGSIAIHYCPWCGSPLPKDLADEWFDRLEQMGLEPEDSDVPVEMLTDAWWINEGL